MREREREIQKILTPHLYMHIARTYFAPAMQYTNAQRVIKPLANPSQTVYTLPERERANWNIERGSL